MRRTVEGPSPAGSRASLSIVAGAETTADVFLASLYTASNAGFDSYALAVRNPAGNVAVALEVPAACLRTPPDAPPCVGARLETTAGGVNLLLWAAVDDAACTGWTVAPRGSRGEPAADQPAWHDHIVIARQDACPSLVARDAGALAAELGALWRRATAGLRACSVAALQVAPDVTLQRLVDVHRALTEGVGSQRIVVASLRRTRVPLACEGALLLP